MIKVPSLWFVVFLKHQMPNCIILDLMKDTKEKLAFQCGQPRKADENFNFNSMIHALPPRNAHNGIQNTHKFSYSKPKKTVLYHKSFWIKTTQIIRDVFLVDQILYLCKPPISTKLVKATNGMEWKQEMNLFITASVLLTENRWIYSSYLVLRMNTNSHLWV